MKKLNTLLSLLLCLFIFFSTFSTAFALSTDSENYKILIEQGFTEDYLNKLTDSMINKMAEKVKDATDPDYISDYEYLLLVGIPEEFLKGLPEGTLSKIRDYISDGNVSDISFSAQKAASSDAVIKTLSLQLTDNDKEAILSETVCIYWEHEVNKPINRNEDFIKVSWNGEIFCYDADTFYAEDYRRNNPEEIWKVSDSYSELATISLDSIGHWTRLYTLKKQVGGFMIFKLLPTHPIDADADCDSSISADYSYDEEARELSTVILCIVFILLALTALSVIMRLRKKKHKR